MPAPLPDPSARLRAVSADVNSSLEFFSTAFGPPALKTLTVAPIPGSFGQGFPGLVYLSTIAYLEPSARPAAVATRPLSQMTTTTRLTPVTYATVSIVVLVLLVVVLFATHVL